MDFEEQLVSFIQFFFLLKSDKTIKVRGTGVAKYWLLSSAGTVEITNFYN